MEFAEKGDDHNINEYSSDVIKKSGQGDSYLDIVEDMEGLMGFYFGKVIGKTLGKQKC